MKAISLWQPYATFVRDDLKWNETRSRLTHYRGELAICSAKRKMWPGEFGTDIGWLVNRMLTLWYEKNKLKPRAKRPALFPKGYVLCVVDLIECKPVEEAFPSPMEKLMGDYSAGRFAWITRHNRPLKQPVPVVGHQGFFNLPPDVEAKVRAQL